MLNFLLYALIGITAGILSGMLGIGGGVIIVPALVYLAGFNELKAQGTSLALMLPPIGIFAFLEYYKKGNVNLIAGIIIIIFLVAGSILGAKIAHSVSPVFLKRSFGILMIIVALKMLFSK